jgi:transcriptional regulator with XRE-family HTH domain
VTKVVGANIKRFRRKKGLTQYQLAQDIGLRQESISRIEKGKYNPSLGTLERIAKALGVTVAELLKEDDEATA